MDRPTFVFIDVQNKEFAPIGQLLEGRGFGIVANGAFSSLIPRAEIWESFVPSGIDKIIEQELTTFADHATKVIGCETGRKAFCHPRGSFIPRTGTRFFNDLLAFRSNQIREIETLENLSRQRPIAGIILGCDNSHTQRTLVLHARKLGIPTIQLAHGIYGSMKHLSYAANMDHVYADFAAIFGDRAEEHMLLLGNDPAKIVKVGSPTWHSMFLNAKEPNRAAARWQLGLPTGGKVVLFTCGYSEAGSAFFKQMTARYVEIHQALAKAMKMVGENVHFLLRPHPTELNRRGQLDEERNLVGRAYLDWMSQMAGTQPTLSLGDVSLAIKASDVVVAVGSSSVVGAAIQLQRPTINIPLIAGESPTFLESDGVVFADGPDLGVAIKRMLDDSRFREQHIGAQNDARGVLNFGNSADPCGPIVEFLVEQAQKEVGDRPQGAEDHTAALGAASRQDWTTSKRILDSLLKEGSMGRRRQTELLNDRGVINHRMGDYQAALNDLSDALRLSPLEPEVLENIHCLLQDGRAQHHFRGLGDSSSMVGC